MSAAVGASVSSTTTANDVPYNPRLEEQQQQHDAEQTEPDDDDDDDDSRLDSDGELDLGPQFTLKEQLEKDKVSFFICF